MQTRHKQLSLAYAATAITGFVYHATSAHIAGPFPNVWMGLHLVAVAACLYFTARHLLLHKRYYASFAKRNAKQRHKATLITTFIFIAVLLTGLALLPVYLTHTPLGLWHYRLGIFLTLSVFIHYRGHMLRKLC